MADLVEPLSWSALAYSSLVWLTSVDPYPDALDEVDDSYDEDEEDERMLQAALETAGSAESEMAVRQEGSRSARWGAPGDDSVGGDDVAAVPVALIPALAAYFAALTRHIFATMREAIDRSDRDADADTAGRAGRPSRHSSGSDARLATAEHYSDAETEAEDAPLLQRRPAGGDNPVEVTYSDITRMGLDPLSESVRLFVQAFVRRWWDREARIEANGITCCGLRVL
ncbi:hypothetical protein KEM52_002422 [Ascosphaera acerosa]|nr:hypothetical protein KEM52_002422 [Ascosphaera acerosa]